ncbi:MAG: hypothetical protein KJ737_15575 [Proteobacteria bacterium]|nr:hypothetical protein [Pseudomonadota bacterium]
MAFLEKFKNLHDDLTENVPMTEKITSLINARNTYGEADELQVRELFEEWPKTDAELLKIKKRVIQTPM